MPRPGAWVADLSLVSGEARGYGSSMFTRLVVLAILAGTGSPVHADEHRNPAPHHVAARSKKKHRGSKKDQNVGHKIGKPFRHVGGKLQKFFTGHDTISR